MEVIIGIALEFSYSGFYDSLISKLFPCENFVSVCMYVAIGRLTSHHFFPAYEIPYIYVVLI